jgi:hypothetical protein
MVTKTELVEQEKSEYIIDYEKDEEGLVKYLRIEKIYYPIYPHGNHVAYVLKIDYSDPTEMKLTIYYRRMSWNGTGSDVVMEAAVDFHFAEDPWFLTKELEEIIERDGVKETVKAILEDLKELFIDALTIKI